MPVIGPENPANQPNYPASSDGPLPGGSSPSKTDQSSVDVTGGQIDLPTAGLREQIARESTVPVDELISGAPVGGSLVDETIPKPKKRRGSHSRKSVLNSSPHKEEYLRLMSEGWSSGALERYAAYRYGETITASAFRTIKSRIKSQKPDWLKPEQLTGKNRGAITEDGDHRVDVMKIRHQLAVLQMQRISTDVKTELDLGKLFSSTKGEIELLNVLLDRIKTDEEDYGLRAPIAQQQEVTVRDLPATVAPRHQTLADALGAGGLDRAQLISVARELGKIVPINRAREAG